MLTITYDLSTAVGQVRALIPDRPMLPTGEANPDGALLSDQEIECYLAVEGGVPRATALALETIASDQVLLFKVVSQGDLRVDGAAMAKTLLARAAQLRATVAESEDAAGAFDWAEIVTDPFAARERLRAQWLRRAT